MTIVAILYSGKISQKNISRDFALKRTFCGIIFTMCMLIRSSCLCVGNNNFANKREILTSEGSFPLYGTL